MADTVRFRLQGRTFEVPADDPRLARLPATAEMLGAGSAEAPWAPPPGAATMGPADPSLMRHREIAPGVADSTGYDPMKEATLHSAFGNLGDAAMSAKEAAFDAPENLDFGTAYRYAMERRRRLAGGLSPGAQAVASTAGSMIPFGMGQKLAGAKGIIGAGAARGALTASPDDPQDTFASAEDATRRAAGGAAEAAGGLAVGKMIGGTMRGIGRLFQKAETPPALPAPPPETGVRMVEHNTGILDPKGNPIIKMEEIPFTKTFPAPPAPPPPSFPLGKGLDRFYMKLPGVPISVRIPAPENLSIPQGLGSKMGAAGRSLARGGEVVELGLPASMPDTHDELDWAIWRALGGQ